MNNCSRARDLPAESNKSRSKKSLDILDQYPDLYRECTCENFDYYGITDEASCEDYICPLCKLGHDDEEIEDFGVGEK
ncbi:hypothetical protein RhiirC2_803938 [Rhizophagus irregularis]|uniref:Uncharacterized protein n=1 Tax=Rhizophagus irregularis TaxID=588596 RepID=A0A2N1L7S3_9GLOM|nr:hypothetical protein RhiirC2_803938 [Rhizophagus irregularis]